MRAIEALRGLPLLMALLPSAAVGLASDSEKPMVIEADSAELDDRSGISTYKGNVKVVQGTMVLTGETMTVYIKNDSVDKVIVEGAPATYKQRPDGKERDINARSGHMEYFTDPQKVVLEKDAQVEQEGDVLRSERIVYDVSRNQVTANGGSNPDQRVRITLQPKSKKNQNQK